MVTLLIRALKRMAPPSPSPSPPPPSKKQKEEEADNNHPPPSNTEVSNTSNIFPDRMASAHHPTSSNVIENRQQLVPQEHQSTLLPQHHTMLPPQQHSSASQLECLPHFRTNFPNQLRNDIVPNVTRSDVARTIFSAHPTRLSIATDQKFLHTAHNFLRNQCIEVFVSDGKFNSKKRGRGSKCNVVGLRCVYCRHVSRQERANQAVSFPSKTAYIYESVRNFQRSHFDACDHIPNHIKTTYKGLAQQNHRHIQAKFVKVYMAEAAREIGMVETSNGLIFGAPPNTSGMPSKKLLAIMKIADNPIANAHLQEVIFPKVDDRIKNLKFSHIASEKTRQVIENCRLGEAAFLDPSDFPTVSDYRYVLYHQFVPCRPSVVALRRRKTQPEQWDTLSGLRCKHCAAAPPGPGGGCQLDRGMYFFLDPESLHDSYGITDHIMSCENVPSEVKGALTELQRLAGEHGVTTKRGEKQRFMKTMWERLANYYPASSK